MGTNYSFNTTYHVGETNLEAELFSAATSVSGEELEAYAESFFTIQREILFREGREIHRAAYPP